jgi:hypothetical protein
MTVLTSSQKFYIFKGGNWVPQFEDHLPCHYLGEWAPAPKYSRAKMTNGL